MKEKSNSKIMMKKIVEVLSNKEILINRCLAVILEKIQGAISERGFCTIALSGGSTPKPLYEAIAKQELPWSKIHVFWGDERYVPADHPDSNQKMARIAWLDRIDIPESNIHPMLTESNDPEVDAEKHETELRNFFQISSEEIPVFDIILLGIGDDGHTASLFPYTPVLDVKDKLVSVGNKDGQPRLTFSVPLINKARCVIFLVSGASKQPAIAAIWAESEDDRKYPARLIHPESGELLWLLDQAAGEKINN